MRSMVPCLLAVLALSCSTNINESGLSAVTGDTDYGSTDTMRLEIEQTSSPMTFRGDSSVDVCFRITIANATKEPMRIRRISLQSTGGGSYRLEASSRKFNRTINAGETESFRYWASALASDPAAGTSAPLVVRTAVDAMTGSGAVHAVFHRKVNGEIAITVGSEH